MATNRVWNDPSGNKKDATEFHTVVAWGRLGEVANQYLKKGSLVMIEGRIQTRTWTDPNNNKRYFTEVVAEGLQLGPRTANTTVSDIKPVDTNPRQDKKDPEPSRQGGSHGADADIPVIDANEPVSSGVVEDEVKIKEEDLPF